jgi:uncharacterized protein
MMANSKPVLGIDDLPMWASMERGRLELQRCNDCGSFRYPPAPVCPKCLSVAATWTPLSGQGQILSWVVFHKKYFDNHPPPYNSVAVQLQEGPIIVTQLEGPEPAGSWIGQPVVLGYSEHTGRMRHHARIAAKG